MTYFQHIKKQFKFKYYVNYILVLSALLIFTVLESTGVLRRSTANLLTQMGFSIILAVSLNLVVGFLGELSLGHAGFMCVGAYIGCYLGGIFSSFISSKLLVLIISIVIGGLAAALFGFLVGLPALRLKGDYLAIVTLAFGEIVRTVCKNLPFFGKSLGLKTETYGEKLFIPVFVVALVMLILIQNLIKSKHGRAITAIRDNEIAAKAMGINITYYKLFVFIISAFFAGVAGVLYGNFTTPVLYSFFSYNYSIEILVMVVLGGMGNITGSILSAALITFVNHFLTSKLPSNLAPIKYLIYALILMLVVIFNNAPSLQKYKEMLSIVSIRKKIYESKKKKNPEKFAADIKNDAAQWSRIPTKIKMDEILSTDVVQNESGILDQGDKPSAK